MSSDGQIVIPQDVRDRLGLRPGETFRIIEDGGVLTLHRRRKAEVSFADATARLREIVRYAGPPVSIEDMNDTIEQCWIESAVRSDRAGD